MTSEAKAITETTWIPLGVVAFVIATAISVAVWATRVDAKVDAKTETNAHDLIALSQVVNELAKTQNDYRTETLNRREQNIGALASINNRLSRIEDRLGIKQPR